MPGKPKLYVPRGQDPQVREDSRCVALRQRRQAQRQDRARPHPDYGDDEHYPEGTYYLEWYEHSEHHGKAVCDFATVAEAARLKAFEAEALKAG